MHSVLSCNPEYNNAIITAAWRRTTRDLSRPPLCGMEYGHDLRYLDGRGTESDTGGHCTTVVDIR